MFNTSIHKQITKEEIENPELDKDLQELLTAQTVAYVVVEDKIQSVVEAKRSEYDAADIIKKDYDSHFTNELIQLDAVEKEHRIKIPDHSELVKKYRTIKEKLESDGNHQQKGAEIFTGTKNTQTNIVIFKSASWVLYILGFISTVYFLVTVAEMEWMPAIFLPLAGVSVIFWGAKVLLWGLSKANLPLYPVVKYFLGVTGLLCAAAWLYYYSKLAGSFTEAINIGSLDDSSSTSSGHSESNIMIYLGAIGEALVGAFLYAVGNDIKEKHTSFDGLKNTPAYDEALKNFKEATTAFEHSNSRIQHAQNLRAIINSKRDSIDSEAKVIFNRLFQKSLQ